MGILVVGVEMFIGAPLLAIDFLVRTSPRGEKKW